MQISMAAGMPYPHRTYRDSAPKGDGLKLRKGNGTIACAETAEREEVAGRPDGQGKVGMVNARLRKSQSPWRNFRTAAKAIETPSRFDEGY